MTTIDDDDDSRGGVAVDDHGGAPPSPLPSLLPDALASLSLPTLSVAFGLPLFAFLLRSSPPRATGTTATTSTSASTVTTWEDVGRINISTVIVGEMTR